MLLFRFNRLFKLRELNDLRTNLCEHPMAFEKLVGDDGGSRQNHTGGGDSFPETAQVLVELPHFFWPPGLPEARLLFSLVHPIQGEPVEEGRVLVAATNTHEFPLPVLIGLLEDGENGPPSDPIEANP